MMEWIRRINDVLNGFVWGPVVLALLVGIGLWLSFATGFFQFRRFSGILKNTLGRIFSPKAKNNASITPFQALTTALAGSVGTGNIAGVAGAILLGGPGAVFWMWISALFGMMTKFAEVFLAVRFRRKNSLGEWVGGPMYYIEGGLGKRARPLACAFALFGVLASFGMGNMAQVNTLVTSVVGALNTLTKIDTVKNEQMIRLAAGGFVALLTGLVIIGGVKRIGSVTERVIPLMSVLYFAVA
ncbi:MAG: sodium:alanine symporter family protein, partial [Clostridia bacterium]|nr:sodium:alanine symporter family protein [Clostridia bacterium]